ncbi:hypothetical protein QBC47DRAFT_411236 [Echria macrotheca]|uniref:Uncharacterized protein n=1 Tax=Echria macrotheca TaxID=438768 RepID=A0AAJ0FCN7_9PEZI|nr:hypothetical protein QBC47DRAFT_411236 [Echria macrotheca]
MRLPRSTLDALVDELLPLEARSPRGGGGGGGGRGGGGGSSSGGGKSGSSGSSGSGSGSGGSHGSSGSGSSTKGSSTPGSSSGSSSSSSGSVGAGAAAGAGVGAGAVVAGSSSGTSSKSSSSTRVNGPGYIGTWPIWAVILTAVLSAVLLLFLCGLAWGYSIEKKRAAGGKIRHGRVWWKAFCFATFLWIPIAIFKCCCCCFRKKGRHDKGAGEGDYSKIEGGAVHNIPNSGNNWFGAAGYGEGGTAQTGGKYEPYTSPNHSPDMGYAQQTAAPPPYSPATVGQGAAVEYYAQHPLKASNASSPGESSPGPAPVTFPTTSQPVAAPLVHNPYSMSATYTPGHP